MNNYYFKKFVEIKVVYTMLQTDKTKLSLVVEVLNAKDVPRERLKKNDPYVVLLFKGFFSFYFL